MSKKLLIGSSQYADKFLAVQTRLLFQGHEVKIPAFDSHDDLDSLGTLEYNRSLVEWADEIHLIWDNRSSGTIFDYGMVFYSRKPLVIEYIEGKTFQKSMEEYASRTI
jgi:hypothetical protein